MEVLFSYYHILVFGLGLVWILIFLLQPEVRREMILLGILSLFLLPLAFTVNNTGTDEIQSAFQAIGVLDLLFSFALSGIAGTIFHAIFGKHYHRLPKTKNRTREENEPLVQFWTLRLFLTFLVFTWTVVLLAYLFDLSLAVSAFIASVMVAIYLLSHRRDLLIDSLASGALTMFVVFITAWLANVFANVDFSIAPVASDVLFLGVPLDLLLWSAALGLAIGPVYEFIRRLELK